MYSLPQLGLILGSVGRYAEAAKLFDEARQFGRKYGVRPLLADAAEADPAYLHRVLRHLASRGVFEEPEQGRFALSDAGRGLLEPGIRLGMNLDGFGGRMARAWTSLLTAVRTGAPERK